MNSTQVSSDAADGTPRPTAVAMRLEVVVVPVSDVDRAKAFYQGLGWRFDGDFPGGDGYRVVQFTPPGSDASIIFGSGVTSDEPGSIDSILLAVDDIDAAREELRSRGADVSEVFHDPAGGLGGGWRPGTQHRAPGPDPEGRSYGTYASFNDPDGNKWLLQEITERLPGRV
jgi:catechol 2,3-dioxygenase-like lactoylglutathione lyase family enzyme